MKQKSDNIPPAHRTSTIEPHEPFPPMLPDLIANRYRRLRSLGEGSMGQVWLVEDTATNDEVALKLLSDRSGVTEKDALQLKQEFRLMTHLRHPHIVEELDYGLLPDGTPYFTMEVVEGNDLNEMLPLPQEEGRRVLAQALLALGYLHRQDLVHCDIKPANLRVKPDGSVKLMDFGLMEYAGRTGGAIKGTLAYLAPEVIKRGAIDGRTDLYAIGALAYELFTGQAPFHRPTAMEVLRAHVTEPPVPPRRLVPSLDPALESWLLKLLAKDPLERYQSAEEALAELGIEPPAGQGGRLLTSPPVGREDTMTALRDRLARVARGESGGAVLITGSAGLGKSRLVEEFRNQVLLAHVACGVGMAHEHRRAPYAPLISVLKTLLPVLREHAPEAIAQHGPAIARLLPELGMLPAPELASHQEKARLQHALAELLAALAHRRPLVIVLGDWQWTERLSREALEVLVRRLRDCPAMVMLTAREARVPLVDTMPLGHLKPADVRRMVASMLGAPDVASDLVDTVILLSEGNPFYVERLMIHLVQSGYLVWRQGGWRATAPLDANSLPKNLSGLLLGKLAALPPAARDIAHAVALQGRVCDLAVLVQATGLSEAAVFEALNLLRREQILMQHAEGLYRFTQEQFQECLEDHMDAVEKTRWHAALAVALERRAGGIPASDMPLKQVTAIARHAIAGGLTAMTAVYALEAGLRHRDLFANEEAAKLFQDGLAALESDQGPSTDSLRLEYWRALGDVLRWKGEWQESQKAYQRAALLAETLGERKLLGRLMTSLAKAYRSAEGFNEALRCCERALAIAYEANDPAGAARSLITSSHLHLLMAQPQRAIENASRALELARQAGHRSFESQALAELGYLTIAYAPEAMQYGIAYLQDSIRLMAELGNVMGEETSYDALGNALYRMGDWAGAREAFSHALRLAESIRVEAHADFARLNLSLVALEQGSFEEALTLVDAVLAGESQRQFEQVLSRAVRALALAHLGRLAESRTVMDEAITRLVAAPEEDRELAGFTRHLQAEWALTLGDARQAHLAAEALAVLLQVSSDPVFECQLGATLAALLTREGHHEQALAAAERALVAAEHAHSKGHRVRALLIRAHVAMNREDWSMARGTALEALALAERLGNRFLMVQILSILGELWLAAGQPEARNWYTRMAQLADELEVPVWGAIARFGLAASAPYEAKAPQYAATARDGLSALLTELDGEARAQYLSLPERRRVLEGNYVGFSIPKSSQQTSPRLPGILGSL